MTLLDAPVESRSLRGDPITLAEHVRELRRRVLVCLAALAAGTLLAWFGYDRAIDFMIGPYRQFLDHHPRLDISHGDLVTTGPLEGFTTRLKVSGYFGMVLAAPIWLWQIWRFAAPGLYKTERRYALGFLLAATTLFASGVGTAVAVYPKAIGWMISVSGSGIVPLFSPSKYFGLYALACVVFGAVFTYPVFLVGLELVGAVSSSKLRSWRRYSIVIICAVAAVITPSSDPFSFMAMAIPMIVFYEASILAGRLLHR